MVMLGLLFHTEGPKVSFLTLHQSVVFQLLKFSFSCVIFHTSVVAMLFYHRFVAYVALVCLVWSRAVQGLDEEILTVTASLASVDRLGKFYSRISQSDAVYCQDRTKLLPSCDRCIPGLQQSVEGGPCDTYIPRYTIHNVPRLHSLHV